LLHYPSPSKPIGPYIVIAEKPPSTIISDPVTKLEASEAK
jgi:hypothetical protein